MDLVPLLKSLGATLIALTSSTHSPLGKEADIALAWGDLREADPLALVPTVSASVTLALGDALTVALMNARMEKGEFDPESYRLFHPSGAIGKKLRTRVIDLLRGPHTNPCVPETATFGEALDEVTSKTLGGVSVVDAQGRLLGIITDGDIRRHLQESRGSTEELLLRRASELMTTNPTVVHPEDRAVDALQLMENHKPRPIYLLPVTDHDGRAVGMIHVHTLVQAGLTQDREAE
jgi:arabinose-5-phosphate isomerase